MASSPTLDQTVQHARLPRPPSTFSLVRGLPVDVSTETSDDAIASSCPKVATDSCVDVARYALDALPSSSSFIPCEEALPLPRHSLLPLEEGCSATKQEGAKAGIVAGRFPLAPIDIPLPNATALSPLPTRCVEEAGMVMIRGRLPPRRRVARRLDPIAGPLVAVPPAR